MKKEDQNQSADEADLVDAMGAEEKTPVGVAKTDEEDTDEAKSEPGQPGHSDDELGYMDGVDVDPEKGVDFSASIAVAGEQMIPLNQLKEWKHHPAIGSRTRGANAAGLIASASEPANLSPIVLMPAEDGVYPILDGRLRWHALQAVHGEESDVKVRCVMFTGSEAEAVQTTCDSALGGEPRSAIEIARSVLNVQRVAGISQKAIAERYSVLKKDQVSRMTIAAKTVEKFRPVFALLEEPDRVSIDLCVKFAQFMKSASADEREAVMERMEVLTSEGVSLKRNELFEALEIAQDEGTTASPKSDPLEPVHSTPIMGHDDEPVGALEMLRDNVQRLRLPNLAGMTPMQREEAAEAFIKQIRIYFELDVAE